MSLRDRRTLLARTTPASPRPRPRERRAAISGSDRAPHRPALSYPRGPSTPGPRGAGVAPRSPSPRAPSTSAPSSSGRPRRAPLGLASGFVLRRRCVFRPRAGPRRGSSRAPCGGRLRMTWSRAPSATRRREGSLRLDRGCAGTRPRRRVPAARAAIPWASSFEHSRSEVRRRGHRPRSARPARLSTGAAARTRARHRRREVSQTTRDRAQRERPAPVRAARP